MTDDATDSPARPFTPASLAEHWGCSSAHVYNLLSAGTLRGFRLGKLWRIRPADVEAFEAQSAVQAAECPSASASTPQAAEATPGVRETERRMAVRMVRLTGTR